MPTVSKIQQFLSRSGDIFNVMGVVCLLGYMQFGKLLQVKKDSTNATKTGQDEDDKMNDPPPSRPAKPEAADMPLAGLPPVWTSLLLTLAELFASLRLLDPSDDLVRRAISDAVKVTSKGKKGFFGNLETFEKLMRKPDVYVLFRFVVLVCGLGSVFLSLLVGSHGSTIGSKHAPLAAIKRSVLNVIHPLWAPRLLFLQVVLIAFMFGNWSSIKKFIANSDTLELFVATPEFLRAIAAAGTVVATSHVGPIPYWACFQGMAALTHFCHLYLAEAGDKRILFNVSSGGGENVQAALLMHMWSVLMLFPCAFKNRKLMLLVPFLAAPCIALLKDGQDSQLMSSLLPYMEYARGRFSICFAVLVACMVFFGGLPLMVACLALTQSMVFIHNLEALSV